MLPSWAITLLIVISCAGILIMVAVIFAIKPRRHQPTLPPLGRPAHQNAPAHQGAPIHLQSAPVHQIVPAHHQSAPAHQNASEDSASVDSEFAADIHEALNAGSQHTDDDTQLSIQTQTQVDISPVRQSASDDSGASIETPTPTPGPIRPVDQA